MDKRFKIIGITAIVLFSIIFTVMVGFFVVKPLADRAKQKEIEVERAAKEALQQGDSITHVFVHRQDSLKQKIVIDSVQHIKEKESLAIKFKSKIKKYESRLADIDTLNDIQLDGAFSTREMLSDSASKVW